MRIQQAIQHYRGPEAPGCGRDRGGVTTLIEGPPLRIAAVLSPHDTPEEIAKRVEQFLACGVKVVWVVTTPFRTVTVHRPGVHPEARDACGVLPGDPELPGFSCAGADFFR